MKYNSKTQVEEFKSYAEKAGLTVETFAVPSTNEIASTVNVMTSKVDAIWVQLITPLHQPFQQLYQATNQLKNQSTQVRLPW